MEELDVLVQWRVLQASLGEGGGGVSGPPEALSGPATGMGPEMETETEMEMGMRCAPCRPSRSAPRAERKALKARMRRLKDGDRSSLQAAGVCAFWMTRKSRSGPQKGASMSLQLEIVAIN